MADKVIRHRRRQWLWGDAARATPQLLAAEALYIVLRPPAEITMSDHGSAWPRRNQRLRPGFQRRDEAQPTTIAERSIKVISNAGGPNPRLCRGAAVIAEQDWRLLWLA